MSREAVLAVEKEVASRYIGKEDVVHGCILAVLSGHHLVQLGPPGNAKTEVTRDIAYYLDAKFFTNLMNQYTTADEVLGPVSIMGLKADKIKRVTTGRLPEAEIAFLDEIFKSSPAILNVLLKMLQERKFDNDGEVDVPLITCFAASNELPAEDEGLGPVYDRFLLRFNTGYLDSPTHIHQLLKLNSKSPRYVKPLTREVLVAARKEVSELVLSDEAADAMVYLWGEAQEEGFIFSDRRLKQMVDVMAAESWLNGDSEITPDSLVVGQHILWDKPETGTPA
jgi:MoxR-like ATPase